MSAAWDRRTAKEQDRVQRLTLARWLPLVAGAARHWQERVEELGVAPGQFTDLAHLHQLRPSRGRELAWAGGTGGAGLVLRPDENQFKAYADAEMLGRMVSSLRRDQDVGRRLVMLHEFQPVQVHRAGPFGQLHVVSSRSDLDRMHRTGARAAQVLGVDAGDVLLNAAPMTPTLDFYGVYHLALGASLLAAHPRGVGGGSGAIVDAARALMPTVLVVRPAEALTVAQSLQADGADLQRLRLVVLLGPPPAAEFRAEVVEAYADAGATVEVRALWGPPEGRSLWAECGAGHGLHTYPDLEVLEVIDPLTGRPTVGDGDLTMTTMGWHGTALLRLQTGTWVDPLATGPCPGCDRTVPRLVGDLAPSAWEVEFAVDDESVVALDLRGVPAVLSSWSQVTAWRAVLQQADGVHAGERFSVEVADGVDPAQQELLQSQLADACGVMPELVVGVHPEELAWAIEESGGPFADLR